MDLLQKSMTQMRKFVEYGLNTRVGIKEHCDENKMWEYYKKVTDHY